jgi:hypothetical protein
MDLVSPRGVETGVFDGYFQDSARVTLAVVGVGAVRARGVSATSVCRRCCGSGLRKLSDPT